MRQFFMASRQREGACAIRERRCDPPGMLPSAFFSLLSGKLRSIKVQCLLSARSCRSIISMFMLSMRPNSCSLLSNWTDTSWPA